MSSYYLVWCEPLTTDTPGMVLTRDKFRAAIHECYKAEEILYDKRCFLMAASGRVDAAREEMRLAVQQKLEMAEKNVRDGMLVEARQCLAQAVAARIRGKKKVKHARMWMKEAKIGRNIAAADVRAATDDCRDARLAFEAEHCA